MIRFFRRKPLTGSIPSLHDSRDYEYTVHFPITSSSFPKIPSYTKWSYTPNQRNGESCVAFSINRLLQLAVYFDVLEESGFEHYARFSEKHIWFNARERCGWPEENRGVYIREAFKAVFKKGVLGYQAMPYEGNLLEKPSEVNDSYAETLGYHLLLAKKYKYFSVRKEDIVALLDSGVPVLVGIYTNDSFYNNTYVKDIPKNGYGHAMVAEEIIEKDNVKYLKFLNWWGKGYIYIPYSYFLENVYECWTIRKIQGVNK